MLKRKRTVLFAASNYTFNQMQAATLEDLIPDEFN